ncbi:hypothetical protein D3C72_2480270 [compost metagenome]
MGHVAQAKGHAHHVEMRIGERQLFSVADQRGQHHSGINQAITPHAQHGFVDVGVHHTA